MDTSQYLYQILIPNTQLPILVNLQLPSEDLIILDQKIFIFDTWVGEVGWGEVRWMDGCLDGWDPDLF